MPSLKTVKPCARKFSTSRPPAISNTTPGEVSAEHLADKLPAVSDSLDWRLRLHLRRTPEKLRILAPEKGIDLALRCCSPRLTAVAPK